MPTPTTAANSAVMSTTASLRRAILRGDYRLGERGPGRTALVNTHGLTPYQADRVLSALETEGLLARVRGAAPVIMHSA